MTSYLDRLLTLLRPRSLVMLAVDGVAPSAKIQQQRTRRYTSALRRVEAARHRAAAVRELLSEGGCGADARTLLEAEEVEAAASAVFDSNIITPGTPFMARMEAHLRAFLEERLAGSQAWAELEVVWSPSTEPGEGEHKIMHFLRRRRSLPGFQPAAVRAVVGQDADLILLALATHEPRCLVVRETFRTRGEEAAPSTEREEGEEIVTLPGREEALAASVAHPIELIDISALREALAWEFAHLLGGPPVSDSGSEDDSDDAEDGGWSSGDEAVSRNQVPGLPYAGRVQKKKSVFDLERIVDDIVFISGLLGNDFLPPVPSLDIHEGGMDALWGAYRASLPRSGYVSLKGEATEGGRGLAGLLAELARGEKERLKALGEAAERKARGAARRAQQKQQAEAEAAEEERAGEGVDRDFDLQDVVIRPKAVTATGEGGGKGKRGGLRSSASARAELKRRVEERVESLFSPALHSSTGLGGERVALGTEGDGERYYLRHFPGLAPEGVPAASSRASSDWLAGLGWVGAYYYSGASAATGAPWRWSYPHPVAPLLRDLVACGAAAARALLPSPAQAARLGEEDGEGRKGMSVAERKRLRARRKAAACTAAFRPPSSDQLEERERAAERDAVIQAASEEWASHPDGPVPMALQLLAVIPPESAPACYPPLCARLLAAVNEAAAAGVAGGGQSQSSPLLRALRDAFPCAEETRKMVRRGHRFSWQAVVMVPSAPHALLAAALAQLGGGGRGEAEEEEEEEEGTPDLQSNTVLLVNHLRHPDAAFIIASILSGGGGGGEDDTPAAGGAARLLHAADFAKQQQSPSADGDDSSGNGCVFAAPLDIRSPAPPFGGGRLAGATAPPRTVSRELWRAAQKGALAPRWKQPSLAAPVRGAAAGASALSRQEMAVSEPPEFYIPAANGFWPSGWDFRALERHLPPSILPPPPPPPPKAPLHIWDF